MFGLDKLFSNLNSGAKEFIGVSLNVNGLLEVVDTSRVNTSVEKYTNRNVAYNPITREVENYDQLKNELESALEELHLQPKNCNITISLPNVLFGITQLPEILNDDEITNAIISQAEESYIFKREEPVVSWDKIGNTEIANMSMQKIAYSVIQVSALKELKRIFTELGANLISIQNSYSSLMQGLDFAKITDKVGKSEKKPWNILLISSTCYSIFNFVDDKLNDYYEEPFAVKSFSREEVYSAVSAMVTPTLKNYPAANLLVISDTNEVSAEVISTKLGFDGVPFYIEQNQYQQSPPIDIDLNVLPGYVPQISIAAVGAAVDHFESKFFKFNYLVTTDGSSNYEASDLITIGDRTFELTKEKANKLTMILAGAMLVIFGGIYFGLNNWSAKLDEQSSNIAQKESQLQQELSAIQASGNKTVVNISSTIDNILDANRKKMLYYDALSYGIPEKLWIEHFYAGPNKAIAIHGIALDNNDITAFLKGIREVAGESNVSVTKLTLTGEDTILGSGTEAYSFVLSSSGYNDSYMNAEAKPASSNSNIPPANKKSALPPIIH